MKVCIITGSAGLIGSEAVRFFASKFDKIIGIDNNQRAKLFGKGASTWPNAYTLIEDYSNYVHNSVDIRDEISIHKIFSEHKADIKLIIHTAAQPSHDWAAKEPKTDFTINANGTLNLLEATRIHCPEAVFIFTSTNKVYGDTPNNLPLVELNTRFELHADHKYYYGIDETMTIDQSKHSLFGVSKLSADLMVQEYGRYFGMNTGVFRGGCLTGPNHAGTQMHGFLSYLMKCAVTGDLYTVNGYKGKQVRDNIHSYDLVNMFYHFYQNPRPGEVYNAGGSRHSNCSIMEAMELCEKITGYKMNWAYIDVPRSGDHIWWISGVFKFVEHYPQWKYKYSLQDTLQQIHDSLTVKK
jgi:CDP-paratose 2-epimerase